MHQQAHLGLSHIVFGLRLREGHPAQLLRVAQHDLLGQAFAQLIGEVLHHHRLQAKAGLLPPLQQRAPPERLQRLQHLRAQHPGMQDLHEGVERRPLAQHGQPGEQQVLQGREPPHLLAQHRADAVEDQFPFLQEAVEISTEEVGDRLRHDLEGQGIARVAGHEALPGSRCAARVPCRRAGHGRSVRPAPPGAASAPGSAVPSSGFDLPGLLAGGEQHAALVGRLGQAPDQPPVALVARQVAALGVPARQQRLQVVEHQQAAARLQARHELVMRCSSEVGKAAGGVSEKKVRQSATSSSQEGASRTERQSTASKWGARRLPQVGGQRTLADAAHAQQRHQAAALLHDPLGEFGHFHLAAREVAHVEGFHQVDARGGGRLRCRVGSGRPGRWGKLDGREEERAGHAARPHPAAPSGAPPSTARGSPPPRARRQRLAAAPPGQ